MPYIENFEEFARRQGCEYLRVDPARLLFANGAVWEEHGRGIIRGLEPPTEPAELNHLRRRFVAQQLQRAQRDLSALRNQISMQAQFFAKGCGPHPDSRWPGWEEQVHTMSQYVALLQQQLHEPASQAEDNQRASSYDERRRAERQSAAAVLQKLAELPR